MKYYISKTHIALDASGRLSGYETVLTRPDTLKAAQEALRRFKAIGITSIQLYARIPRTHAAMVNLIERQVDDEVKRES